MHRRSFVALGMILFAFQLHMILTNDTTIEYFGEVLATSPGVPRERVDNGPRQNWIQHFGDPSLLGVIRAFALPVAAPPLGNGLLFERNKQAEVRNPLAAQKQRFQH